MVVDVCWRLLFTHLEDGKRNIPMAKSLWDFSISENNAFSSASAVAATVPIKTARELRVIETASCRTLEVKASLKQ